jgi:phage tail-like protein
MSIVGSVKSFNKKHLFRVEIDGFVSAAFSKISAPECEVGESKHYEGGTSIPNKSAGRLDFKDITLERGSTQSDLDSYAWFVQVANAPANVGGLDVVYKRHLDIVQLDRTGLPISRWSLFNAWPKMYSPGEWDNNTDDVLIEKMVLAYDYFVRTL